MGKDKESNIWYLVSALLIFFFLFQYTHIFVLTTLKECAEHAEFWLSPAIGDLAVYHIFLLAFLLFGLWSVVETVWAYHVQSGDRVVCTVATVLIVASVMFVVLGARAQWEAYEIFSGERKYEDFNFKPRWSVPLEYMRKSCSSQNGQ